jgi:predicted esterase
MVISNSFSESPLTPGQHERHFTASWDGSKEPYYLYLPASYEDADELLPLMIVLHGYGANYRSWFEATDICEWAEEEGYVVLSPHGRGSWFYLGPGESDLMDAIRDVTENVNVDARRMYLMGHSMGGWGTWRTACAYPGMFAGIVPMSAWAPVELLGNLRGTPVLTFHGDADDVVLPDYTREAVAKLEELDIPVTYHEIAGAGHESSMISDVLPQVSDWLEANADARGFGFSPPSDLEDLRHMADAEGWITQVAFEPRYLGNFWNALNVHQFQLENELLELRLYFEEANILLVNSNCITELDVSCQATEKYRRFSMDFNKKRFYLNPSITVGPITNCNSLKWTKNSDDNGSTASYSQDKFVKKPFQPIETEAVFTETETHLHDRIVSLLLNNIEADIALIPKSFLAPELREAPITFHDVQYLYVRPDDRLLTKKMTKTELVALLAQEDLRPGWWSGFVLPETWPDGFEDDAELVVIYPNDVARVLPWDDHATTSWRIRRILFENIGDL